MYVHPTQRGIGVPSYFLFFILLPARFHRTPPSVSILRSPDGVRPLRAEFSSVLVIPTRRLPFRPDDDPDVISAARAPAAFEFRFRRFPPTFQPPQSCTPQGLLCSRYPGPLDLQKSGLLVSMLRRDHVKLEVSFDVFFFFFHC